MRLTYEAWPGTLGPVVGTPSRRPGSIRRTTSIHSTWVDGDPDDLLFTAIGRDLLTGPDGEATAVDTSRIEIRAGGPTKVIAAIRSEPAIASIDLLAGRSLVGGFRRLVGTGLALGAGSVSASLLDDLPAAALVSGSARLRATIEATGDLPGFAHAELPAVCIGRRPDGVMARRRREGSPLIGQGPAAGDLACPGDPMAWPPEPPLAPHGMRRVRRTDVALADEQIVVDSYFRDSYRDATGVESSVHEYQVLIGAGRRDHVIETVDVRSRVLPGPDCPGAAPSAQAVIGRPLVELRRFVHHEIRGDSSCTHLNDQLRSCADVPSLVQSLEGHLRSSTGS